MNTLDGYKEKFELFDCIPAGVCVLRQDFTVLFWNNCLENWTQVPRTEIVGTDIRLRFPHLQEPKYTSRLTPIFEGGPPTIFSSQLHKSIIPAPFSNGRLRIQHTTVTALEASDGQEFYAILVIQDVTDLTLQSQAYREMRDQALEEIKERKRIEEALRESEERYAKIFEEGPLGMAIFDFDYRFLQVNTTFCQMVGYTELELVTLRFDHLIHEDDLELNFQSTHKLLMDEVRAYKIEQRFIRKNKELLWITLTASLIHGQDGQPLYGLAMIEDITERKRSEKAIQEANQQLRGLVRELEEHNREITLLSEIGGILQACLTLEEAYTAISQLVQPLFPNTSGAVFSVQSSDNLVKAISMWGTEFDSQTHFGLTDCWALRRRNFHWVDNKHSSLLCHHIHPLPGSSAETHLKFPRTIYHPTLSCSLCVPMMAQGEALGLLYLSASDKRQLTEAKRQLAVTVAEHIALGLANLKLRETLHNQSIRDPLTGLFNRRYMEESLQREIHAAKRKCYPLGVIMLDVDHFKRFNDTYGHEAGDMVLRELGAFLQKNIRKSDIACRYGGEELTLILPETNLIEARKRAEELRQGIRNLTLIYQGQPLGLLTASFGVACFPHQGHTGEEVIRVADLALYQAKAEGRDRVVCTSTSILTSDQPFQEIRDLEEYSSPTPPSSQV